VVAPTPSRRLRLAGGTSDLVRYAERAGDAGFAFALISDHYHPWIDKQGQSPFVWCVIGGIAEATAQLGTLLRFYEREVLPQLGKALKRKKAA
jgi:alkanesulfonate monooxygenase SsuD/methylene tetrahydromethanopterin reductase-like flavin-dependent oxidoreductase (luciferase family)